MTTAQGRKTMRTRTARGAFAAALAAMLAIAPAPGWTAGAAMEFCRGPVRVTCVVDGDTVWIEGEKIRLADIDAPEPGGACEAERVTAARAAGRLARLLREGGYVIERSGRDTYGRTLATISIGGRSVGAILVAEGLARPWSGRRERWC